MTKIPVVIKAIKQEIERREWSVQTISEKSGVSMANVYNVFNGDTSPTIQTVEKLLKALDMYLVVALK